jgi:hypothetical protein
MKCIPSQLSDSERVVVVVGLSAVSFGALLLGFLGVLSYWFSETAPSNLRSMAAGCGCFGVLGLCTAFVLVARKLRRNHGHEDDSR